MLHVPGHTPGEIALHIPDRTVLLSGDGLLTRDLFTGRHGPPALAPAPLTDDVAAAGRSAIAVRELGTLTVLPGHGNPWTGDLAAVIPAVGP